MRTYTDQELEALLDDLESDRVERKRSFKGDTPVKARQAVCAFANDLPDHNEPGILFIGAQDDGAPSSEPITDRLLQSLSDMRTDGNTLPMPVISVEKRRLKDAEMAVVFVMPSDMPPVRYDGRIWVRVGPRRAVATEQEERTLSEKRRFLNPSYTDLRPIWNASISDLSQAVFEEKYLPASFAKDVLETNGRSYEERLAALQMIVSVFNPVPTLMGMLAIGKNPQRFIQGAYIQFLRIDGTEYSDPVIDAQDFDGHIQSMLFKTLAVCRAYNPSAYEVGNAPTHTITYDYPPEAVEQVIYNAIMHRSYEYENDHIKISWFNNRVEITSPGTTYGIVTQTNFGKPGEYSYRNPNISVMMKTLGYVEKFGRGLLIANGAMQRNGNPEIEYTISSTKICVTLRRTLRKKKIRTILEESERTEFIDDSQ